MRISDWSSDVCSSDLLAASGPYTTLAQIGVHTNKDGTLEVDTEALDAALKANPAAVTAMINPAVEDAANPGLAGAMKSVQDKLQDEDSGALVRAQERRSEEHTSELQSLMRISYAVFCLKKKNSKRRRMNIMNKSAKETTKVKNTPYK